LVNYSYTVKYNDKVYFIFDWNVSLSYCIYYIFGLIAVDILIWLLYMAVSFPKNAYYDAADEQRYVRQRPLGEVKKLDNEIEREEGEDGAVWGWIDEGVDYF